jgi:hypothetical protein
MCLAIATLAIAAAGTGYSVYSGQKAAGAQRDAMRAEANRNALEQARQKREAIRAGTIARANAQQSAENQGVAGSSSALGGAGSITSQANSNYSFLDRYDQFTNKASQAGIAAAGYAANAQMGSAISDLALTAYSNPGFTNMFKPKGTG